MYNKGTRLLLAGKNEKAIQCFKKQLKEFEFKECYLNMGNAYRNSDMDDKAIECYIKANSPDIPYGGGGYSTYPLALNNLGLMMYSYGNVDQAIALYEQAVALSPNYGEALWNLGNARLKRSNCVEGWDLYEYRFDRGPGSVVINNNIKAWDEVSCGDRICVVTEQGLGDRIMFGRYLDKLKDYFKEIVVVCPPGLEEIYAPYKTTEYAEGTVSIPMCSLARIFGITSEKWVKTEFEKYEFTKGKLNIGVVSTGSTTHVNNRNRSCPGHHMSGLARFGNLYGLNPSDPKLRNVSTLAPKTWRETASYCKGLDVIVSVDTSIVHLAGTLGVPVIMVQPKKESDFRWGMPGMKNVWYDSVHVVHNENNWDKAFESVHAMLDAIC